MLKRVAWAFLHSQQLHPSLHLPATATHPFSFLPATHVHSLIQSPTPPHNPDHLTLPPTPSLTHSLPFKQGVVQAYRLVLADFTRGADFISSSYCTPELSFSLNFLSFRLKNMGFELPNCFIENTPVITVTVLGEWYEMKEARSNDKVLGLWDTRHIRREVMAGIVGPEVKLMNNKVHADDTTYIPIKQSVRVAYAVKYEGSGSGSGGSGDSSDVSNSNSSMECSHERLDVFDWERSLSCPEDEQEWTVANINGLLVKTS